MKGIYLALLLTVCVFLAIGIEGPQCFHFTWPGVGVLDRELEESYCKNHTKDNPFTPCIEPLHISPEKPNVTEIWEKINTDEKYKNYTRRLELGYVCVRYTYMYNGAVMNVSYFHGKVTEGQTTPVTSGCYVQYTEGYSIEACACKSNNNSMPCNSTIRNTYSSLIIFVAAAVSLFMYKIFDIS